jgi:hypothetical protein
MSSRCHFKVFRKVGTNRITGIVPKFMKLTQIILMIGQHMLEGAVVLRETIHALHRENGQVFILHIF